ncbi:putative serine/threonine-protein kinase ifkC [Prunus yedoensis var. nudiflora]|uniref:Putative serine/threonine-protein kinase ifkC n=1 Tax=Prunus yedoensis var. nudiflora TaxID=2094558 RepID=A0A314YIJ2_PRUYE|nr:putative serine/threonine-protein kinase ifkC [Prunus yedoensis var. nudiflora]
MSQLQHQHIVQYHTVWLKPFLAGLNNVVDDDDEGSSSVINVDLSHLYIQMELYDSTLKDILENDKIIIEDMCWSIFANIMAGLTYMHAQGIIHGDLSHANIFRCGDMWKIGDFGLARNVNDENDDKVIQSIDMKEIMLGINILVVSSKNRIDKKTHAVKKVEIGRFPDFDYNQVIREVETMTLLDHDNIIQYHMALFEPVLVGINSDIGDVSNDDYEFGGLDQVIHIDDIVGLYKALDEMVTATVDVYNAGFLLFAMMLQRKPIVKMGRIKEIQALKVARINMLPDDWDDFPWR